MQRFVLRTLRTGEVGRMGRSSRGACRIPCRSRGVRVRGWLLILKWTVRHRRWLSRYEREIAKGNPTVWWIA